MFLTLLASIPTFTRCTMLCLAHDLKSRRCCENMLWKCTAITPFSRVPWVPLPSDWSSSGRLMLVICVCTRTMPPTQLTLVCLPLPTIACFVNVFPLIGHGLCTNLSFICGRSSGLMDVIGWHSFVRSLSSQILCRIRATGLVVKDETSDREGELKKKQPADLSTKLTIPFFCPRYRPSIRLNTTRLPKPKSRVDLGDPNSIP